MSGLFERNNYQYRNKIQLKNIGIYLTGNSQLKNMFNLAKSASLLQHNIIIELNKNGPLTRRDLVKKLNKARTTIYDNLSKLQKRKIVSKFSRNNRERGRPQIFWELNVK